MNRLLPSICSSVLFCCIGLMGSQSHKQNKVLEYPAPTIREEQFVTVNGVTETWRLQWNEVPRPYCGADEIDRALTCPCMGFAYGESGDLYLVRLRNGSEVDRLRLTPLFTEEESAVLQHSPVDAQDLKLSNREDFSSIVIKRPIVQIMQLDDYDHDGGRTEFYLQTESAPCGKSVGVVVGLSTASPRLHVFGTVSKPAEPLYLQRREWQALRDASSGSVNVIDWPCDDHGAETQTEIQLQWSARGIEGTRREYTCPANHQSRRLLKEGPL